MRIFRMGSALIFLVVLMGCTDAKTLDRSLTNGVYKLSQVKFTQDGRKIREFLPEGHEIAVNVGGTTITISMAQDITPPTGPVTGYNFTAWSLKNLDTIPDTNCEDRWSKKVTGTIVKKDTFTGTYEFEDQALSGEDCNNESLIGFKPPSCKSSMTFTATRSR